MKKILVILVVLSVLIITINSHENGTDIVAIVVMFVVYGQFCNYNTIVKIKTPDIEIDIKNVKNNKNEK